jgi:uncharacterized protein (DUF1684 family)
MKIISRFLCFFLILIFPVSIIAQSNDAYKKSIAEWDAQRIQKLKSEAGWLNLAGLYWLQDGYNSFGTDPEGSIRFPEGSIAKQAGYFIRTADAVWLEANPDVPIMVDGKVQRKALIFEPDSEKASQLSIGSLRWVVIKREDKIGIRLRDLKNPKVQSFKAIERFPVNEKWRIEARLVKEESKKNIPILNIIGQTTKQETPGKLEFSIDGKPYSLDALLDDDKLFVIFGDLTNEKETYPSGRFLIAEQPNEKGITILDFNKAYNPPCAFTDFATCPLPPKQNILPIRISAGEKKVGH